MKTIIIDDDTLDKVVIIKGTKYDRKRKRSDQAIKKMKKLYKNGFTYSDLAYIYSVSPSTVRYHLDDAFRKEYNATRSNKVYGTIKKSKQNRVDYKRYLVSQGLVKVDKKRF